MTGTGKGSALPAPFLCGPYPLRADWIDYNGHLNLAYYVMLFDWATDALWEPIGLGAALRGRGFGTFAAEAHTLYRAELVQGESVEVTAQILGVDTKRLQVAQEMRRLPDGTISAQQELLYLSVDLGTRRVTPWPDDVRAGLDAAAQAHAALARPEWVGRTVGLGPLRR